MTGRPVSASRRCRAGPSALGVAACPAISGYLTRANPQRFVGLLDYREILLDQPRLARLEKVPLESKMTKLT